MISEVILVDKDDNEIGTMEKMEAHQKGLLHRAFSVFIFNEKGELLLQRRALSKYHSPGLWSNTCCSHPFPNETTEAAAMRRLQEEMGISANIKFAFSFIYKIKFGNGLTEHEFDHVYVGNSNQVVKINKEEVMDYRFIRLEDVIISIEQNPENFTEWFKICIHKYITFIKENF